ncbi:DUF2971 domain-containing protein [Vibrio parahaemolyticus]|uniref:DUF2971 domain-containing protein n=1 Tax=Vibrio parahaemolyticus TaxID=670 RepID=UPI0022699B0A|nr:DUF2971 domain-containing protein [Vibrio parahaemolyticus]MCX8814205.1 DUF2971 domain-containing protein [Vibrio parahaemolyticus]MCX8840024.1 DUF2971 domain-containing protein [Vibrio parahaemolyticus]MCX8910698.1 DUF2971 domain-containing protein [Vibrio parahaemolyticus]HCH0820009.1 DUF2971 domain-containing protein [Vibrio parahaemolyticus]HCM0814536.1 DUF2971 domain-containing protein [Vibrio parahaemolyticus]
MLYKYRSLDNLKFTLDILVNQRLYASPFNDLNDPMEGAFIYGENKLPAWISKFIMEERSDYRILSLTEDPNNMLMWSHYANSHKGVALGVKPTADFAVEPVDYVAKLDLDIMQDDIIKSIFMRKLDLWKYEREHRVISNNSPFIGVEVHEIIFGINAEQTTMDLVSSVALAFNPDVSIRQLTERELKSNLTP